MSANYENTSPDDDQRNFISLNYNQGNQGILAILLDILE